jgi:hypothetical protein
MQTTAGIILIIGSLLIFSAAFNPLSNRVFDYRITPEQRVTIVADAPTQWAIVSVLFAAGSVVAAIGLAFFARHVAEIGLMRESTLAWGAAVVASIGALCWVIVNYYRITHSPEQVFLGGSLSGDWLFPAYTILTQISLLVVGYVLVQAGYPGWLGWGMVGLVGLTIVVAVITRDMPPFAHYVWLFVMGVSLIVMAAPRAAIATTTVGH